MRIGARWMIIWAALCLLGGALITDERGNQVQGQGNTWEGSKNSINGHSNEVVGNSNQISGSKNTVQGSNNVVGQLSEKELLQLQEQMAARFGQRFGNIFETRMTSNQHQPLPQSPQHPAAQQQIPYRNNLNKTAAIRKGNQNLKMPMEKEQQKSVHSQDLSSDAKPLKGRSSGLVFRSYGGYSGKPKAAWGIELSSGRASGWKCKRFGMCTEGRGIMFSSIYASPSSFEDQIQE